MTPFEQAKSMLPNVPAEMFDIFFAPLIAYAGWPFSNPSDLTIGTSWYNLLGNSLYNFINLRWHLSTLILNENVLDPSSNSTIMTLVIDHSFNIETPARRIIENSKERFLWHVEFMRRTRRFCAPVVAAKTPTGLKILDGNHRMAALYSLRLHHTIAVDAWIGS